jgi:hypothetical protein
MRHLVLSALALCTLAAAASAAVTNGGFNTDAAGWSGSNIDGAGGYRSTGGNPGGFFILNDSGGATDPTISQNVGPLVTGASYHVSFDAVTVYNQSAALNSLGFTIDNQTFQFTPSNSFATYAANFVYGGGTTVLAISAERNGSDSDAGIDNVAISVLPEPAAALLILPAMFVRRARAWRQGNR